MSGIEVTVPALPASDRPDPTRWNTALSQAIGEPNRQTIVVAHSLGCLATLRYLTRCPEPWHLRSLVLVSGFTEPLPVLPQLNDFIEGGCEVSGLAERVDRLTVIRSDSDEFVPIGHTDRLAAKLGTTAIVSQGRGHFLDSNGVTTAPEILGAI